MMSYPRIPDADLPALLRTMQHIRAFEEKVDVVAKDALLGEVETAKVTLGAKQSSTITVQPMALMKRRSPR